MQVLNFLSSNFWILFGDIGILIIGIMWGWRAHSIRVEQLKKKEAEIEAQKRESQKPVVSKPVPETTQIVDGKRYSTLDSKCIAQGATAWGWAWVMRTNNDNYFLVSQTFFGLQAIFPQTQREAIAFHTSCTTREVSFQEAFPGVKIQDA